MEWATFNSLIGTERESGFRFPRVISSAAETNTKSIPRRSNGNEIIGKFSSADQLCTAVTVGGCFGLINPVLMLVFMLRAKPAEPAAGQV